MTRGFRGNRVRIDGAATVRGAQTGQCRVQHPRRVGSVAVYAVLATSGRASDAIPLQLRSTPAHDVPECHSDGDTWVTSTADSRANDAGRKHRTGHVCSARSRMTDLPKRSRASIMRWRRSAFGEERVRYSSRSSTCGMIRPSGR